MKENYPIKYAVMPINKPRTWDNNYQNEIDFYTVSKCYLIGEKTKYNVNGMSKRFYEVVFPYQMNNYYNDSLNKVIPEYGFNGECINFEVVSDIFDNTDDAWIKCQELNNILKTKSLSYISFGENWQDKINSIVEEYDKKNDLARDISCEILNNTKLLDVCRDVVPQELIVQNGGKSFIFNISIYDYMSLFLNISYRVYSVPEDVFRNIKQMVKEDKTFEISSECRKYILSNNSLEKIVRLIDKDNEKSARFIEDGRIKCSATLHNPDLTYDSVVYTTESLKDIINSYKQYPIIKIKSLRKD